METPESNELRSLDRIHQDIRRALARIEIELAPLVGAWERSDPEVSPERFDISCARLESHVGELDRTLANLDAVGPVDVNRLASRLLEELLLRIEKPLVLRVSWADDLQQPMVSSAPLRSLLARVLDLFGRFACSGDEIAVETVGVDEAVVFRISIQPADPEHSGVETFEQLSQRSSTLEEFVVELGGEFELTRAGGAMRLEIRLPQEASRR